MAIDNFLIANQHLTKLSLINVAMNNECLKIFLPSVRDSLTLRSLNISQNPLKDSGAN